MLWHCVMSLQAEDRVNRELEKAAMFQAREAKRTRRAKKIKCFADEDDDGKKSKKGMVAFKDHILTHSNLN